MAVRTKKVAPKDVKPRRGPLAHSGNGFQPALDFIATLRGREKTYVMALVDYIMHIRVTTRPPCPLSPERDRAINDVMDNLFSAEEPS